jgi:branched-chain amino acid transport system permease protein
MNRFLRRAFFSGLVGGAASIHVSIVGIVETFQRKNVITDVLTLGILLPSLFAFVVGYYAGGPWRTGARERPSQGLALASGALAGGVSGTVLSMLVAFIDVVDPRVMFVSATPGLVRILTFDAGIVTGGLLLVGLATAAGTAGAALRVIPPLTARALSVALIVTLFVALMERFVNQVLINLPLDPVGRFLFTRSGLTLEGTVALFLGVAILTFVWASRGEIVRQRVAERPAGQQRGIQIAAFVALFAALLILPQITGPFLAEVLGSIGIFILLGLGLNIVVGYAGLLDLGYVAFYAVGAYTLAVLTSPVSALALTLNFWLALPFIMLAAAIAGLMIGAPVLRLRGDYLAIVTLGLGEIARLVLLSDWMRPYLGGAQGILSIPPPTVALPIVGEIIFRRPETLYYLILFSCVIGALAAISLANSRIGRAWNAMREDEVVAEATGINTHKYKLLAFVLGATLGCLGGAFFAIKVGSVFPHSFELLVSINALALIILGGMGRIAGVIAGAIVLVGLPELLREFAEFRLLFYGAILVAMMVLRPEGLLPSKQRRMELHDHEEEDAQFEERAGAETGQPVVTS